MDPQTEGTIRLTCFAGVFLVMALVEWLLPRRKLSASKLPRWGSNLALVVLNTVAARFLIPLSAVAAAMWAQPHEFGLLNLFSFSVVIKIVLAVAILDFAIYLQHVLFHAVPIFWRLHRVHHADLDLDVTSGLRFHTLEILLSALIKLGVIALLGAPPLAVVIFEVVLNATAMFNHSNVRLPLGLDRVLRLVLVTPDMHRVHHSINRSETNSNFGFNLPWWDYFFGTYCDQPALGHEQMVIGMAEVRDEQQACRLPAMLVMPFVTLKRSPEEPTNNGDPEGNAEGQTPVEKKRPRRKWFQFSLRTLLVMMLVFGCGLGWFTAKRRQAQQAWKRIEEARELGIALCDETNACHYGKIPHEGTMFEESLGIALPAPPVFAKIPLTGDPKEIISLLANFPALADIHVDAVNLTDEHLASLATATRVTRLRIASSPLHGTGLAYLAGMTSLQELELSACERLNDEAVKSIPNLLSLTRLVIKDCPITGANLSRLATTCPQLEFLILRNTQLNEHGMLELGKVSQLKRLDLEQTPITDDGMAHLVGLQDLEELILGKTGIGDKGLLQLQNKRLERLDLSSTQVTDFSAPLFARFPSLKDLLLHGTKVTDASVPALAKLPQIEFLTLDRTGVTHTSLWNFSDHKTLQYLYLPMQQEKFPGVHALRKANPTLHIVLIEAG